MFYDSRKPTEQLNTEKPYTLERAFQETGGFGIFQFISILCLALLRNSGMYFIYAFGYLTLQQQFLCSKSNGFEQCSVKDAICPALERGEHIEYKIDTGYEYYLNNWVQQMELTCIDQQTIAYLMSAYFVGVGLGGLCMHSIADKWGRKKAINLVVILHLLAQYLLLHVTNYYMRMLSFFLIGFF